MATRITPPDLSGILRRHFGYPGFRPGQERLIRAVLAGRDVLGVLPTGGGKTICYQIPAHVLPGLTVVISPLVSLMEDQVGRARQVGLRAAHLASSQGADERRAIRTRVVDGDLDLLLLSPERLVLSNFMDVLQGVEVSLLAVDEVHCIASWGHDFRPSYRRLAGVRRALNAPCLALTATATPAVRAEILDNLGLSNPLVHVGGFDRPNLGWAVERSRDDSTRRARLKAVLRSRPGPALVYAPTRRLAELAGRSLSRMGWPVGVYHAGRTPEERAAVQESFMEGRLRVVSATNAFGMGVDKADVRTVVHMGLPTSLEDFYQEAGRGGRDGDPAWSLALVTPGDRVLQERFVSSSAPPPPALNVFFRSLLRVFGGATEMCLDPERLPRVGPTLLSRLRSGAAPAYHDPMALLAVLAGEGVLEIGASEAAQSTSGGSVRVRLRTPRPDWGRFAARRRRYSLRLRSVVEYSSSRTCRRRVLLEYFGEAAPARCGGCDRCLARISYPPESDSDTFYTSPSGDLTKESVRVMGRAALRAPRPELQGGASKA